MIQLIPRSVTCPCQLLFTSTATLQCYSRVMLFPSRFATLRSAKKQQKQDFSLPSCWILQWVIRRGEEEGSLHVCKGEKLRASHQLLPVLAMKAHFPESLLMVVTSVTGWTLPASHCFRAVLYGLIASFPAGFTTARLMFSTCASRWTASEQSIVLSQQSRFMISWEGREGAMGNGREEHPFSYTLSAILRRSVFVSGFKIIFQTSCSSITHWPPPPPSLRPCSLIIEMATVSYELERLEPRLMSAQNDSHCHGRQSECVSDDVWLPNTDKVNLFLFWIEIALRKVLLSLF